MRQLNNFPYKNVLVLGLAKSGIATCQVLLRNGLNVTANDLKADLSNPELIKLKEQGVQITVGEHPLSLLDGIDLVIKSPGIPYHNELISNALDRNIPVRTEIELLSYLISQPVIGITGSNGKTTTTMLIDDILSNSKMKSRVAGNIGTVAVEVAEQLQEDETLVLELSSFQLMGIDHFSPKVSVLLNLFEAHLDYHGDFNNYQEAKAMIFNQQTEADYLVYNADDPRVCQLIQSAKATLVPFSIKDKQLEGAWVDEQYVYFKDQQIIKLTDIRLVGEHNLANCLASIAASLLVGANIEGINQTLTTFAGVRHRLQFVTERNGRQFYNDSKATNILATSKALASFKQPTMLIAGGLDRGNAFDDLVPFLTNVKGMFLYGETASKLAEAAHKAGVEIIEQAETLDQMVHAAYAASESGDVILLSPACASWDQFKTFEERGDMFIELVHTL